ncbi:hypothetical protein P7K49_031257 [Saguinus oedipus]|uniref:Uncharacterized protein n=1 Tax=Saguinus oedipus TaxID=9490 RepID=A0ABQ9TYW7_SAGOE|nr:hypothetical protein P7K49_031257 [Saguinus oedipus]
MWKYDIIKLNRKEGKKQNFPRLNRRLLQQSGARQFRMRKIRSDLMDKAKYDLVREGSEEDFTFMGVVI